MSAETLLVELFTEELPPKALKKLGDAFAQKIFESLRNNLLVEMNSTVTAFASPRRLAVQITAVLSKAPDAQTRQKLVPVKVGLTATGEATESLEKALGKFAIGHVNPALLERATDGKTEFLYYSGTHVGIPLVDALQVALDMAIEELPVPRMMSYQILGGAITERFVRPAHGLVALHGSDVVGVRKLGLDAGRTTHGHRFQGAANFELNHADEYESRLEKEGGVIASFEKRRHEIERLLFAHAEQGGDTLGERDGYVALLDEVTGLVEMPTVYAGQFDGEFLQVPPECLVLTMKQNQKYFPLFLSEGGLSSRFLIVSNMRLDDPRNVIEGNQRVVRPRLADARFFFETDKKTKLEDRIPKLANVVYHNKLGSQGERIERVRKLAVSIATQIGADAKLADRAALLAKADLVTEMVGEFPELQGIMGRYYALHDGEAPVVADAIQQHYQPRFAGDRLPDSPVALVLALADKLETLAGLFSIGQAPSGDKDPFALRRHALGVLRMLIERNLPLTVKGLVDLAMKSFSGATPEVNAKLVNYLFDRLTGYLRDLGYSALEVDAVVAVRPAWGEFPLRLGAVRAFATLPEAASLAAANKRIGNILKKTDKPFANANRAKLVEPAEHALFDAVQAARPEFEKYFAAGDYTSALKSLAALKLPVDGFFDGVMVNVDDAGLRENRLALLGDLHALMNKIADLSKLAT